MQNITPTGDGKELVESHSRQQANQSIVVTQVLVLEVRATSARRLAHEPGRGPAHDRAVPQLSQRFIAALQMKAGLDRQDRARLTGEGVIVKLGILWVVNEEMVRALEIGQQARTRKERHVRETLDRFRSRLEQRSVRRADGK